MVKKIVKQAYRSGHQHCEVCGVRSLLVLHHIRGRTIRNANHESNLVRLCSICHELIHIEVPKIIIEGWAMTSEGRTLLWHKNGEASITGNDAKPPQYGGKKL